MKGIFFGAKALKELCLAVEGHVLFNSLFWNEKCAPSLGATIYKLIF